MSAVGFQPTHQCGEARPSVVAYMAIARLLSYDNYNIELRVVRSHFCTHTYFARGRDGKKSHSLQGDMPVHMSPTCLHIEELLLR
jgi:hypothetical protein